MGDENRAGWFFTFSECVTEKNQNNFHKKTHSKATYEDLGYYFANGISNFIRKYKVGYCRKTYVHTLS